MKIKRRIVFLFALLLTGVIYSQNTKQKIVTSRICFGKFVADSIHIASVKEIVLADSLFIAFEKEEDAGRIVSFDVYMQNDQVRITENVYGNRLSKKQRLLIQSCRPGQKIYFQNIMVKYPGKGKIKLNSGFIFAIKN